MSGCVQGFEIDLAQFKGSLVFNQQIRFYIRNSFFEQVIVPVVKAKGSPQFFFYQGKALGMGGMRMGNPNIFENDVFFDGCRHVFIGIGHINRRGFILTDEKILIFIAA